MNKKYLNSALFVLLIIIWGSIVYRYFNKKRAIKEVVKSDMPVTGYMPKYEFAKDTFLLQIINTNPFKASRKRSETVILAKPKVLPKKPITKSTTKTNVVWPTVSYHGFVKGEHSTTRLILIKINNKLYRKREQSTINNITLIKTYNDSLIVSFNNNRKTIKKIHD